MNRRDFFRNAAVAAGGVALGRTLTVEAEATVATAAPPKWMIVDVKEMRVPQFISEGGLCAPAELAYSYDIRPVKDNLPSFEATRGGINAQQKHA